MYPHFRRNTQILFNVSRCLTFARQLDVSRYPRLPSSTAIPASPRQLLVSRYLTPPPLVSGYLRLPSSASRQPLSSPSLVSRKLRLPSSASRQPLFRCSYHIQKKILSTSSVTTLPVNRFALWAKFSVLNISNNYCSFVHSCCFLLRPQYDSSDDTIFVVHGWQNDGDTAWVQDAKDAFLRTVRACRMLKTLSSERCVRAGY